MRKRAGGVGWHPTKDPGLSSNPQPLSLSRALIECKAP